MIQPEPSASPESRTTARFGWRRPREFAASARRRDRKLGRVAIAVALVPPLAVAGIGLGWGDPAVFLGAGLLFLTNLAGMTLAE